MRETFPRLEKESYQNMSNWNEKWPSHCEPLTILWPDPVTLHMPDCKNDLGARLIKEPVGLQESNVFRESTALPHHALEGALHCAHGGEIARKPYCAKPQRSSIIPPSALDGSVVVKSTNSILSCLRAQVLELYSLGSNPIFATRCISGWMI